MNRIHASIAQRVAVVSMVQAVVYYRGLIAAGAAPAAARAKTCALYLLNNAQGTILDELVR